MRLSPATALFSALTHAAVALIGAPALAQLQFEAMDKRHLPPDSDSTWAVACCDVDGDGDPDLIFGNSFERNRLYLSDGTGSFSDATAARMPMDTDYTEAVACCDVDGDGDPDLVFGNWSQQNRLYMNDGSGTFTDATAARMPMDTDYTRAVTCCDVDGDGDQDLVFGNSWQFGVGANRLYLNDGTGTFSDATATRMPADTDSTRTAACCDADGDGDVDLVFGNDMQQNRLYLNDGAGTFSDATATRMPADTDSTRTAACCDADGDGDVDLVFGNDRQQNRLYLNDGTGTFSDATAARMPPDTDSTWAVACIDVDGDADQDLVFGNGLQQNRLYLNDGTGIFSDATATRLPIDADAIQAVVCVDVDGDGDPDLVLANVGRQNRLYLNDGAGALYNGSAARLPTNYDGTYAVACCDVDGDGDPDLVLGSFGQSQNRLYLNDGTGTFFDATAARMPRFNDSTFAVACCDVDGDNDSDLVFGNCGQNRLYLNDGNGTFSDATRLRMPRGFECTSDVACCDVDGDGDLDLLLGNSGRQDRLYLNNGTGTFSDATATRMPPDSDLTNAVACFDVDSDGDTDVILGSLGQNRLYLNDGLGAFTDATASRMPMDNDITQAVAYCDVEGDGDFDLVFGNTSCPYYGVGQPNRLYLNDGTGTFSDATAARFPGDRDDTYAVACSDMDGDGDPDLVFGNLCFQQNRLYLNDGSGTFTDATAARMPMHTDDTRAMACCDVDGDGDLDLVFGDISGVQNRLYFNLLRQLHAPFLPRLAHSYRLDVYARYGRTRLFDVALPVISGAAASIPLPPLGTLGLDPTNMVALPPFVIPQPIGKGSVSIAVPNDPSLVGGTVYGQAVLVQYPVHELLTNVTADAVQR